MEAELTFKPNINKKSQAIADRSSSRKIDFVQREQMFTISREFTKAEKVNQKLQEEASMLTFQPVVNNSAKTPKRVTDAQAANFWERNLAFLNKKEEKCKKMDQAFNRNLTF